MALVTEGLLLEDRYRVERVLGRGSTAAVFLGRDTALDVPVAIKALTGIGPLADQARFGREVRALVALRHPSIVEVRDVGTHQGLPFLVLEYLAGGTLAARASRERIPDDQIRHIAADLLEALAYAHARGVVHRDVKPDNVLMSEDGEAKLADFGLARVAGSQKVTATGLIVGTPQFMAPEVLGGGEATGSSDVYSLAAIAWFMANRRAPHDGSPLEVLEARRRDPAPRGSEGPELRAFLAAAMRGDPAQRPEPPALVRFLREGVPLPPAPGVGGADMAGVTVVTRAPGRAPVEATPPGPGRSGGLALVSALVVGAFALGMASGPGPVSVGATRSTSLGAVQARVDRWDRLVEGVNLDQRIPEILRKVLAVEGELGGNHLKRMQESMEQGRSRRAGLPTSLAELEVHLRRLQGATADVPLGAEVAAEREELRGILGDPSVPFADRWKLFAALGRLRRLDAWVEAWGVPPPYDLAPLLAQLAPHGWEPAPDLLKHGELPPRLDGAPGSEPRLLWHWENQWDRNMPLLRGPVHPDYAAGVIGLGNMIILSSSEGRWKESEHYRVDTSFEADGPRPGAALRLRFGTANMVAPLALKITLNGRQVRFFPPVAFHGKDWWNFETLPKFLATMDLPGELVEEGTNRISFRPEYAPGLQCIHGFEFGWATLEWVSGEG